jgi:ParB/RepB/Spo0J family partition protein
VKSSGALGSTVAAAEAVAGNTFGQQPSPPLAEAPVPASGPVDGKHRLQGAYAIETRLIRPDPNQPRRRFNTEAQREINDSVKRLGILQPITVRFLESENVYQIVTGERRYHAVCEAGLTEIPCWVQALKEEDVLLHQIVENWQRLDMHPYDLAAALARLRDANGYTQADIVRETAKSKGEISKLFAILDLDPTVQRLARDDRSGRITRRHLYAIRPLPVERQLALLARAQHDDLTVDALEQIVRAETARQTGTHPRSPAVACRRFKTPHAVVSFSSRRRQITDDDILAAMDEVRMRLEARPEQAG